MLEACLNSSGRIRKAVKVRESREHLMHIARIPGGDEPLSDQQHCCSFGIPHARATAGMGNLLQGYCSCVAAECRMRQGIMRDLRHYHK